VTHHILGIGLTGTTLTDFEREILRDRTPYAVVLFGRNVGDPEQRRALVAEVKAIAKTPPLIMMDEEGGRVDRLRQIIPGLPSAEAFGEGEKSREMSEWHGRVIGMALRYFDIEVDFAPVVDIRGEMAPNGLERRTFGGNPETVTELAGAFMRGLHASGTASCPKHFPGIGAGTGDSHYEATMINASLDEMLHRELAPYAPLAKEAGAVIVGHGTYPQLDDARVPATLSRRITHGVLREVLGFNGLAISDDMEMHAVSDLGSYESIAERALMAGNDCILFCSHIERIPELHEKLSRRIAESAELQARVKEAEARGDRYRKHCEQLRREGLPALASFDELIGEAARYVEEFQRTRPEQAAVVPDIERRQESRTPGKGRSGREEWT
jgi:beta-N-acetylhexosaminidase